MQYVKGSPYFCQNVQKIKQYKYLDKDLETDILIVGGGICGAILNFYLSKKYDVALIDKGRFGQGCTSCATAILEYQLDEFFSDLKKEINSQEIIDIYKMGQKSIKKIEKFVKEYGNNCEFYKRPSFLYTTNKNEKKLFEDEYNLRINNGLKCKFINSKNNPFPFYVAYGIYDREGGGEFNPYLFSKMLIENAYNQEKIFENTEYVNMTKKDGKIVVSTLYNQKITCNKVVFATGFNLEKFDNQDIIERFVTYSIVTNPIDDFEWQGRATIHDNIKPYHYLRMLADNRIIYGGEDIAFNDKNMQDKKAEKIYQKLFENLIELFPDLKNRLNVEYKFCGCFGTTDNNLGLIGETDIEDVYYFLSCGANGIINAMQGVEILDNIFKGKDDKFRYLFSPLRVLQ